MKQIIRKEVSMIRNLMDLYSLSITASASRMDESAYCLQPALHLLYLHFIITLLTAWLVES